MKDLYSLPNQFEVILHTYSVQFHRKIVSHLSLCRSRLQRGKPKTTSTLEVDHQSQKFLKAAMGHYMSVGGGKFLCASQASYYQASLDEEAQTFIIKL